MTKFDTESLEFLFNKVLTKYNTDLSLYAMASLERRLDRFLSLYHFDSIYHLTDKLIQDNQYYDFFIKEITVNTTEMFRDPTCWKIIRDEILPSLKELPTIRIWHAGCSSGEEVFSMAILLKELGLFDKAKTIASDLNKEVIENAKQGIYSLKSVPINEENYIKSGGLFSLNKYYTVKDNTIQMDSHLLENVKFMRHDLSTGIPFSKFDIILCRNVMIYFNKTLQENVFQLFQKSLFKNSFIIIGKKESMAYYTNAREFSEYNEAEKIYKLIS
ncbi:MAG: chemotaxis protein CheR [Sphingobacteriaceae bacterium]|nr:chemotaxis protein CheR [Sphingobacteriaceae bacterium]